MPAEKHYIDKCDCYSIQKHVIKETDPKVGCFAGFCCNCLMIINVRMHAYHYPLFENGIKTCLRTIALYRTDRILLSKHKWSTIK